DDDARLVALAKIALRGAEDPWTRTAVASSVPTQAGKLLLTLGKVDAKWTDAPGPGRLALLRELCTLAGSRRDPNEVAEVLEVITGLEGKDLARWQMTALEGLADALRRRGTLGA